MKYRNKTKTYPLLRKYNFATSIDGILPLEKKILEIEKRIKNLKLHDEVVAYYTNKSHNNSLSLQQINKLKQGKPISAAPTHCIQIENTFIALAKLKNAPPAPNFSITGMHRMHQTLMNSIYRHGQPGVLRKNTVGIYDWRTRRHLIDCPSPKDVKPLLNEVQHWIDKNKTLPAWVNAVCLHYFLCYIHPYSDGNGRTARFCMRLLLTEQAKLYQLPFERELFNTSQLFGKLYREMLKNKETRLLPMLNYYVTVLKTSMQNEIKVRYN